MTMKTVRLTDGKKGKIFTRLLKKPGLRHNFERYVLVDTELNYK